MLYHTSVNDTTTSATFTSTTTTTTNDNNNDDSWPYPISKYLGIAQVAEAVQEAEAQIARQEAADPILPCVTLLNHYTITIV